MAYKEDMMITKKKAKNYDLFSFHFAQLLW